MLRNFSWKKVAIIIAIAIALGLFEHYIGFGGEVVVTSTPEGDNVFVTPEEHENQFLGEEINVNKPMLITSSAFGYNESIPQEHTCDGQNIGPPLHVSEVSEGVKSLFLIMLKKRIMLIIWNLARNILFQNHWI